ncbi:class A beta-lactamase [Methylobacterium frigidaeris]|uniref:Beta-lactamase n=1 Tax=Methylobacterium frigidaeris TaxID=2038277 RepID=A0AA37M3R2_9HYPH|nr:class A beta-lactamase [Methylobacterium frigidaeris]PIK71125.1 class A beta-lactamase [Methylobacterium frigidaeris]GJD61329.1 Beta-lactamase [Methylobacterium frigidaeris]
MSHPALLQLGLTRRAALIGAAIVASAARSVEAAEDAAARLAQLERRDGGMLGVEVRDTATGRRFGHRADERFPLCSTFKAIAAAAVLARADTGEDDLSRRIAYGHDALLSYAPVTSKHVETGMTLAELCAAAVVWSDNTAANLMLDTIGGPEGITAFARAHGDTVTRLDRTEPTLNTAIPGDVRDTTSPAAMVGLLDNVLLGRALSAESRARLVGWMHDSPTGLKRVRAGLPAGWRTADKTGTGDNGTANVVALIHRPDGAPILSAVYLTGSPAEPAARDALHAEIGRLIARILPGT